MNLTETTRDEGLLATLMAEALRRHSLEDPSWGDLSRFYKKAPSRSGSSRRLYRQWWNKCSAHKRSHYRSMRQGQGCAKAFKSYRVVQLEEAAKSKNEFAFVTALENVRLANRTESQLANIIKLALEAGAYLAARHVAEYAVTRYPDNNELRQSSLALAAPQKLSQAVPRNPGFQANRKWLDDHADEYSGRWVALRAGELLGASKSFDELFNQIGRSKEILFTKA